MHVNLNSIRDVYSMTINNFLLSFALDTRKKMMTEFVTMADDINANINWFNADPNVISSTLWATIRQNAVDHVALIKFERLVLANLQMAGLADTFIEGVDALLLRGLLDKAIVDEDFRSTTEQKTKADTTFRLIPGALGIMSIILFRDLWSVTEE